MLYSSTVLHTSWLYSRQELCFIRESFLSYHLYWHTWQQKTVFSLQSHGNQKTPCHSSVGKLNSPKTPFSTLSQVYQIMVFLHGTIKLTDSMPCFPIAHSSHYFTCGDLNYFWNYSLMPPPFKYLQAYLCLKVVVAHCMPKPLARKQSA